MTVPFMCTATAARTASQTVFLLHLAGKQAINVSGGFDKGISGEEAAKELMTTEAAAFGEETYAVDADIQTAVETYYNAVSAEKDYAKNNISPKQLKELMDAGSEDICIVDLRSEEDYAAGHIEGATFSASITSLILSTPSDSPVRELSFTCSE